jgi:hypothetical protein
MKNTAKIEEEVKKLTKKLRGNRGSLRSHGGNLRNCMKFEEVDENEVDWKIE